MAALPGGRHRRTPTGSSVPISLAETHRRFEPYSTTDARRSMRGHDDFRAAASALLGRAISWSCETRSGRLATAASAVVTLGGSGDRRQAGRRGVDQRAAGHPRIPSRRPARSMTIAGPIGAWRGLLSTCARRVWIFSASTGTARPPATSWLVRSSSDCRLLSRASPAWIRSMYASVCRYSRAVSNTSSCRRRSVVGPRRLDALPRGGKFEFAVLRKSQASHFASATPV